jgi:hypothetical protein
MMFSSYKSDLVSGPGSFLAGLIVLAGGFLWTIRPVPMERRPGADYRKEAAKHVSGDGKNVPALRVKLDGEVRRGEPILQPRGLFYFYNFLFPSAIIACKKTIFASPCIIASDNVAYMSYVKRHNYNGVYLYDKHKIKLGEVSLDKAEYAEIFMSELDKRFGVQLSVEIDDALNKKRRTSTIIFVVILTLFALALLYLNVVHGYRF